MSDIEKLPAEATPLPPTEWGEYRVPLIEAVQRQLDFQNQKALIAYDAAVSNWLINAERMRELGKEQPPKPVQPRRQLFRSVYDEATDIVWVWTELGAPMGQPCPDLLPLIPDPPVGTPKIGPHQYANLFSCLRGDTMPIGARVEVPPAPGPESGVYIKRERLMGAYYEKQQ
jgi:hypothetical protein